VEVGVLIELDQPDVGEDASAVSGIDLFVNYWPAMI